MGSTYTQVRRSTVEIVVDSSDYAGTSRDRFKHAWRDGTHAVLLDPLDLIVRLVALIPPPNFHMLRYHGVFAAHANARSEVVPGRVPEPAAPPLPGQLELKFAA